MELEYQLSYTKRHCMLAYETIWIFKTLVRHKFKKSFDAIWFNAYLCSQFYKDIKSVMQIGFFVDEKLKTMHCLITKIRDNGIWFKHLNVNKSMNYSLHSLVLLTKSKIKLWMKMKSLLSFVEYWFCAHS